MRKSIIFTAIALTALIWASTTPVWAQLNTSVKPSARSPVSRLAFSRDTHAIQISGAYEKVVLQAVSSAAKYNAYTLTVQSGFYTQHKLLDLVKAQLAGAGNPAKNAFYACTSKGNKKYEGVYVQSYALPHMDLANTALVRPIVVLQAQTSKSFARCNQSTKAAALPERIKANIFAVENTVGIPDGVSWTSINGLKVSFDQASPPPRDSATLFEPGPANWSPVTFSLNANNDDTKAIAEVFDAVLQGSPMQGSITVRLLHPKSYADVTTFELKDLTLVSFAPVGPASDANPGGLASTFTVIPGSVQINSNP